MKGQKNIDHDHRPIHFTYSYLKKGADYYLKKQKRNLQVKNIANRL